MQSEDFKWFVEHYSDLYAKYGTSYLANSNKRSSVLLTAPKTPAMLPLLSSHLGSLLFSSAMGATPATRIMWSPYRSM